MAGRGGLWFCGCSGGVLLLGRRGSAGASAPVASHVLVAAQARQLAPSWPASWRQGRSRSAPRCSGCKAALNNRVHPGTCRRPPKWTPALPASCRQCLECRAQSHSAGGLRQQGGARRGARRGGGAGGLQTRDGGMGRRAGVAGGAAAVLRAAACWGGGGGAWHSAQRSGAGGPSAGQVGQLHGRVASPRSCGGRADRGGGAGSRRQPVAPAARCGGGATAGGGVNGRCRPAARGSPVLPLPTGSSPRTRHFAAHASVSGKLEGAAECAHDRQMRPPGPMSRSSWPAARQSDLLVDRGVPAALPAERASCTCLRAPLAVPCS